VLYAPEARVAGCCSVAPFALARTSLFALTVCTRRYRKPAITALDGDTVYLGFNDEWNSDCETCGYSWSSSEPGGGGAGQQLYGYNYLWNAEVGMRSFWEDGEKGWNKPSKWFRWCPFGYERDSWKWWSAKCAIPKNDRFLGEACDDKKQCVNDFSECLRLRPRLDPY
jgi:hypothetical protein